MKRLREPLGKALARTPGKEAVAKVPVARLQAVNRANGVSEDTQARAAASGEAIGKSPMLHQVGINPGEIIKLILTCPLAVFECY